MEAARRARDGIRDRVNRLVAEPPTEAALSET